MSGARVELRGVHKRYAAVDGKEGPAVLRDVDATIEPGDAVAIVGPSGCGKSTLLHLIGGLDRPSAGTVRLDGKDLVTMSEVALAHLRNEWIGFVFQEHHLLPQCTAIENVLVPTLVRADPAARRVAPDRARRLLERVGLGERTHHRPAQLSGGERQRVAVVRALINEPALLLADEPTGSLDRGGAERLGVLLRELNEEEELSLVVVTHSGSLAETMTRTLRLEDGHLLEQGSGS